MPSYVATAEYPSVADLCAAVETSRDAQGRFPSLGQENQHRDYGSWGGVPLDTFLTEIRTGQAGSAGAALVEDLVADLVATLPPLPTLRRVRTRDRQGAQVCIHAVLRGDLRHSWIRTTRQDTLRHDPLVTLCLCGSYSVVTQHEEILWSTAATLALAYTLEQAGWRVGLVSTQALRELYREGDAFWACWLKRYQDPWTTQDVAVTMRPEWLRRLSFRRWEMAQPQLHLASNYGLPQVWASWTRAWAIEQQWPHPFLGATPEHDRLHDAATARQWITAQLHTLEAA